MPKPDSIKIRNDGEEDVDPATLILNEDNFRDHPKEQLALYREFVQEIGFLGRVLVSRTTRKVIDGHMRVFDFKERGQLIPVQWVKFNTAREEKAALLMYDQVGEMAIFNKWKLEKLTKQITFGSELTNRFLASLPDVQTIGEQILQETSYLFDGDDSDEEEEDELDFDSLLNDLGGLSSGKKKSPVKLVLKGAQAAKFRQLVAEAGKTGEIGDSSVVMVILSE